MFGFMNHPFKRRFTMLAAALFVYECIFQVLSLLFVMTGLPLFSDGGLPMILSSLTGTLLMYLMLRTMLPPPLQMLMPEQRTAFHPFRPFLHSFRHPLLPTDRQADKRCDTRSTLVPHGFGKWRRTETGDVQSTLNPSSQGQNTDSADEHTPFADIEPWFLDEIYLPPHVRQRVLSYEETRKHTSGLNGKDGDTGNGTAADTRLGSNIDANMGANADADADAELDAAETIESYLDAYLKKITGSRMTILTFLAFFLIINGVQLFSFFLTFPIQEGLHHLGFSLEYAQETASGVKTSFWLLFYTVIAAPLIEEFIFRGMVLHTLLPCGRIFAALASALIFALMHTNPLQFFTAFFLGLLFSYLCERYGLCITMLLHFCNNLFVQLTGFIAEYVPRSSLILNITMTIGGLVLLRWLRINREKIKTSFHNDTTLKPALKAFFTTPPMLLLMLLYLLITAGNVR